jgi:hypothetical protein
MANEHITAAMVEVSEFPQLAVRYQVQGVPKTVINETHGFVGALPELKVAQEVLRAIGK